ncbi:Serine--tRNA ligase, mitochondrial [Coemansia sp. Benny D115]|nr:Serine--tRNA ligase, mitochondrial [Coemansia sp. Benny D115]
MHTKVLAAAARQLRRLPLAKWSFQNAQRRGLVQPSYNYRHIRDNADTLLKNAQQRNVLDAQPHLVGKLYDQFRHLQTQVNERRAELNTLSKQLAVQARNKQADTAGLRKQAADIKAMIQQIEKQASEVEAQMRVEASKLPNDTHVDTPLGDESQARTVRVHGRLHEAGEKIPGSQAEFRDHYDLALSLGLVDMEAGARVAGSRFHFWRGSGALLELALVQYAMGRAVAAGFEPHITPDIARSSVVDACGFRARDAASQIYGVAPVAEGEAAVTAAAAADPLCLVATAEIALTGMHQQQTLGANELPQRMAGLSHCFRAEAGARGRDTRGIYRLHQFTKVELVTLCAPGQGDIELERLVNLQSSLYADLGLTFRVLQMPTHELGASAFQKYDIEAWMPGRRMWGEVSSASNCTDYQARRLGIRARREGGVEFVHTLNATAVAVPRLAVAILETHQRADGSVVVPEVLRPWMLGRDVLKPTSGAQ